eukprot:351772-Chlamydomonas_euryale.AAC.2
MGAPCLGLGMLHETHAFGGTLRGFPTGYMFGGGNTHLKSCKLCKFLNSWQTSLYIYVANASAQAPKIDVLVS